MRHIRGLFAKARQLLADAGYPNGFDTGDYFCDAALTYMGEPVVNYLNAIGIRVKLRPIERAAFQKGWIEKKYRGLVQGGNGSFGNAATRIESLVIGGGTYVYGSYADIDGLFREQASELDRKTREAILHRIQQLIYDKVVVAPIWQNVPLNGVGPRVQESGIGLVDGYIFSAPYEDVRLKGASDTANGREPRIGVHPLVAHCHLGLGKLYRRTGEREQAQGRLATATTMYHEMDMPFWLEQAEKQVNSSEAPVDKFVTRTTTRVLTRGEPVQAHSRDRPRVCSEKFVLDDPLSPR